MRVPNSFMRPLLLTALAASVAEAGRSLRHAGLSDAALNSFSQRSAIYGARSASSKPQLQTRGDSTAFQFLTNKTASYAVNGTGIPDVDFDIGESYAGSLPVGTNSSDSLFWWFFPSTNPDASKEILIWLNGGPGCSSLEGLLQENGPFIWQYGTYLPVENTWAWNKLTNIVYIEQPVGTGFSVGTPTATSEEDVADQFLLFWKNFVDLFAMQGYKVYVAGESYAGLYCPYISAAMVDANDTSYYNLAGMMIYDPVIGYDDIQGTIVSVPFVDYWAGLHPFNDSFIADIHNRSDSCGYTDYVNKYLTYPAAGQQPTILPGQDSDGNTAAECENVYNDIIDAALLVNPCWDIYQVATTCPLLWDVLGFPGTLGYLPEGATIYFDRDDVKKAIHAPNISWSECTDTNVFVDGVDSSLPSGLKVLPQVIDATKNVIIAHGALDFVLIANGTLLAIQNMTWGGKLGFDSPPTQPLYVPYHDDPVEGSWAASGVMGSFVTERGLTYTAVDLSGHMIPQYQPTVAYRQLEFLLGRVDSMSSIAPFTTNSNVTQPTTALGNGNAPQGYVSSNTTASGAPGSTAVKSSASTSWGFSTVTGMLIGLSSAVLLIV